MRLDTVDYRSSQSDERRSQDDNDDYSRKSLLTPARRAALDALEREYRNLLKANPSKRD